MQTKTQSSRLNAGIGNGCLQEAWRSAPAIGTRACSNRKREISRDQLRRDRQGKQAPFRFCAKQAGASVVNARAVACRHALKMRGDMMGRQGRCRHNRTPLSRFRRTQAAFHMKLSARMCGNAGSGCRRRRRRGSSLSRGYATAKQQRKHERAPQVFERSGYVVVGAMSVHRNPVRKQNQR